MVWAKTLELELISATNFGKRGPPQAKNFEVWRLPNAFAYARNRRFESSNSKIFHLRRAYSSRTHLNRIHAYPHAEDFAAPIILRRGAGLAYLLA